MSDAKPEIRLRGVRALRGPSLWATHPVAACEVELAPSLAARPPAAIPDLARQLAAAFPTLSAQTDSGDAAPPTAWASLVGRVAAALQTLAGMETGFVRVFPGLHGDAPQVAVGYTEDEAGVESLYEAEALLNRCLAGQPADAERAVAVLREIHCRVHPGPTASAILVAARRRGIPVRRFPGERAVQLGLGRNLRRLDGSMTDFTSVLATDLTSDKHRTKHVLSTRFGIPVPQGEVATSVEAAMKTAERLGFPVLVKPLDANDGRGISGRIDSAEALERAWEDAATLHEQVVVERFVAGRDHRVLVVNGRVAAVTERIPARVVGDGERTIRALAEETNLDPRREPMNPDRTLVPIPLDEITAEFLARTGRSLGTVPAAGETVFLRATANISTGGTSVDRTDEIHPRNAALCVLAAGAVGLDIAGIDVLTADISIPFDENGAAIIEVNASPGIRMHTDPDEGTPRDVAGAIVDWIYPPGSTGEIPVIGITGTNGKTTTTRLIAHLFRRTGACVGLATTDGIYLQETLLMEGDFTGPFAAGVILSHPQVDVAVLETARGGILRSGLGYDACDVGIVLNVTADHLGLRGIHTVEQLAEVKAVVPAIVKPGGFAVLNAEDPLVLPMRERTPGTVVLTSIAGEGSPAVAGHLSRGGIAVVVEDGGDGEWIVVHRGRRDGERIPIIAVADVPLAMGGAARFQLGNLLAAVAAAHVQGIPAEAIAEGLRTFIPSAASTPGRMNVMRTERGTVIVDYAHNPAAIRGLMEFVARMPGGRRIGVVTMPGDRRDEDLRELGELVAVLDYVVVKEAEQYRRGRPPGEVSRLIGEGLERGGLGADRRETVEFEDAALVRAMDLMEPGDLVVILADDVPAVLAQLAPLVSSNGAPPTGG
ncbi:cyanophycin synthetase [Longimicrobium sp.]|uniref:cyanophycin synthetase n=1 Tax=Longimicrobium sp. TaxID=2029185 RepID=UPI002C80BB01|nr:cyanophycin synthetase [Longimicrobium sp.]HSU13812.1 cyanophycin synthetase [Longimicrobium sp.]